MGDKSNFKFRQNLAFSAATPKFLQAYIKPTPKNDDSDEEPAIAPEARKVPQRPEPDDDDDRPEDDAEKPQLNIDASNFTPEELETFLAENPDAIVSTGKGAKAKSALNPLKRKTAEEDAQKALDKLAAASKSAGGGTAKDSDAKSSSAIGPSAKKTRPAKVGSSSGPAVKKKNLLSFDEEE